jgi:hypothetical protein
MMGTKPGVYVSERAKRIPRIQFGFAIRMDARYEQGQQADRPESGAMEGTYSENALSQN